MANCNREVRDELLKRKRFARLAAGRCVFQEWRLDCNRCRPHRRINRQTPAAEAASLEERAVAAFPPTTPPGPPPRPAIDTSRCSHRFWSKWHDGITKKGIP